jgi:glycosyltransferase involved in cell wall biosynthesis
MLELLAILPFLALSLLHAVNEIRFWMRDGPAHFQACRKVSVIVPLRGVHPGLEENLRAITSQRASADVEYIFVVDSGGDPARAVAEKFGTVVVSGSEGKGAALAAGLRAAGGDCVVFADDDIRPPPTWLERLTAPLSVHVASTAYRWYVGRGLCHKVRLAVSNMGFPALIYSGSRFTWGGSTALRREFAERARLAERLPQHVSDDYAVTSALREAGAAPWFARGAIAPTPDADCTIRDALEWGVRQVLMVKWHSPRGWYAGLAAYTAGFLLSVALPAAGVLLHDYYLLAGLALHPINLAKDVARAAGVRRHAGVPVGAGGAAAAWALGNFVLPLVLWASAFVRCVKWRGRRVCR